MRFEREISIWFFIGVSLLVIGALVMGAGLYEWWIQPPAVPVVLYKLHANVWWGALLFVAGAVYCRHFRPARHNARAVPHAAEKFDETHVR